MVGTGKCFSEINWNGIEISDSNKGNGNGNGNDIMGMGGNG